MTKSMGFIAISGDVDDLTMAACYKCITRNLLQMYWCRNTLFFENISHNNTAIAIWKMWDRMTDIMTLLMSSVEPGKVLSCIY